MTSNIGFKNNLGFLTLNIPDAEKSQYAEFDTRYQLRSELGQPYGYASLGSDGKVPMDQLPTSAVGGITIVQNITARNNIADLFTGHPVFVLDASEDPTVGSGFAEYVYNNGSWIKITDQNTTSIRLGVSKVVYVDAGRQDSYTADGTVLYPFKQIPDAVSAQITGSAYVLFLMPGTYVDDVILVGNVSIVGLDRGVTTISGTVTTSGATNGLFSNVKFTNIVTINDKHDISKCVFTSRILYNTNMSVSMETSVVTASGASVAPISITNTGTVVLCDCEITSSGTSNTIVTGNGKLLVSDCVIVGDAVAAPTVLVGGGVTKMSNTTVMNTAGTVAITYNTMATANEPHELIDMFVTGNVVGGTAYLYIDGIRNLSGNVISGANVSVRPAAQIGYFATIGTTPVTNVQQALDALHQAVAGISIPTVYTQTQMQTAGQSQMHWNNITNKPTIPDAYTKTELQTAGQAIVNYANLTGSPTIPDAYTKTQMQTPGQASMHYDNITNAPTIPDAYTKNDLQTAGQATVSYANLTGVPTIPDAYTKTELQVAGQSTVNYANLTNKPTIPDAYTKTELQTAGQAIVNYANLTGSPTIPDAYTKLELQTPGQAQVDYANLKNVPAASSNEFSTTIIAQNPVQASFTMSGIPYNVTSVVLYPNRGIPQTLAAGDVAVSYIDANSDGDADAVSISLSSALRSLLDPGDVVDVHVVTDTTIHKMS